MIRIDANNPRAVHLGDRLERLLDPQALPPDLCLVLGGDGTMLRAIHELGNRHTFLGLNCGHIGFLLNDVDDPARIAEAIRGGAYRVHAFPRLRMEAHRAAEPCNHGARFPDVPDSPRPDPPTGPHPPERFSSALAVNDVYVERTDTLSCRLRLVIDGIEVVDRLTCDGLVIATSLGSTGYSFSAGGPACHPSLRSIHITPICPRSPRLVPVVVPMGARVEVWPMNPESRPVRAVADWVGFPNIRHLVVRDAHSDVQLAFLDDHDFTGTLVRKVLLV